MKLFQKIYGIFLCLAISFSLGGCCRESQGQRASAYHIITEIQAVYQNDGIEVRRQFFAPEKLQAVVDYLRRIDPYGVPYENPEQVSGRNYILTLHYSDGSVRRYHQRADRYLRQDDGPWKRIDPQQALELSGLFGMMGNDPIPEVVAPAVLFRSKI